MRKRPAQALAFFVFGLCNFDLGNTDGHLLDTSRRPGVRHILRDH